jgi:hypothetical protein
MKKTTMKILLILAMIAIAASIYAKQTIWVCSNHTPAHTATSTSQVQQLTSQYGCSGWYILN